MEMQSAPSTVAELAAVLGLEESNLRALAKKAPQLYLTKPVPKKNGGIRFINPPFNNLKDVQGKILRCILDKLPVHSMLHGGPSTSTKSAAQVHVRQPVVITLDIQNFFPSVTDSAVRHSLSKSGFAPEVADLLTRLTTHRRRLPQGAPTSPALARVALWGACSQLEALLKSISTNARATVYVDDITVSGPSGLERLIPTIIKLFRRNGFTVNPSKKKVMPKIEEQVVLGLRVNRRVEPNSEFTAVLEAERLLRSPTDPRLQGLESYERYITSNE